MYEDEPQDKVHDVLSEAIFGDHPLGRPVIGRGEVVGVPDRRTRSPPTTTPAMSRARSWSRRPATSSTRRSSAWPAHGSPTARATAPRGPRRPLRAAAVSASPFTPRRPSSTTSAWAERASPATTTAASPCRSWTRSWAARPPRACSRRCARSAAWPTRSTPGRASTRTPARSGIYVGTREDNVVQALDVIGTELERVRQEPVGEDELRRACEHVKGRLALSMESTASRMNRLGRSVLMDTPLLTLDETIERLEAVTREDLERAGAASCTRPPACRWPRSGATRACSAERWRPSAPSSATPPSVIRVAVSGAAGRMGETVCAAVEGADDMELVARADPALGTSLEQALTRVEPRRGRRLHGARRPCSRTRGCAWSTTRTRWSAPRAWTRGRSRSCARRPRGRAATA